MSGERARTPKQPAVDLTVFWARLAKEAMSLPGYRRATMRLPLVRLRASGQAVLRDRLERLGFLQGVAT